MKLPIIPIVPTAIAVICVIAMTGLGLWQLDRQAQKEIRLAQLEERKQNHPHSIDELLSLETSIQDFPSQLSGRLLSDKLFYIDNKIYQGQVGFDVIAPLQTERGVVMLNLGWLKSLGSRDLLPTQQIELSNYYFGVVSYPSDNKMIVETNTSATQFPILLQQIDLSIMQTALDMQILDFVVNVDPNPASGYVREWTPVVMAPEKHLGYAIQWFGLAIACLTIYLLSLIKLNKPSSSVL
jgi:cytochrome oxidase assembly protein ShyY1